MLRSAKLTVADEIENALSYYRRHLPARDPALYRELEEALPRPRRSRSFFRMGNWIGGDRDGNPNVDADTLAHALRRQSETALRHYLTAGARARRRAVDLGDAGAGDAGDAGAGRALAATRARTARTSPTGAR